MAPIGGLTCNSGICPDWESSQLPFGPKAGTQSTEPHQPGLILDLKGKTFSLAPLGVMSAVGFGMEEIPFFS